MIGQPMPATEREPTVEEIAAATTEVKDARAAQEAAKDSVARARSEETAANNRLNEAMRRLREMADKLAPPERRGGVR